MIYIIKMKVRALVDLEPGEGGRLQASPAGLVRRLRDLGFVAGTAVRVVRRGPFGDPLEIELRGARFCVRRADLVGLQVEASEAPA